MTDQPHTTNSPSTSLPPEDDDYWKIKQETFIPLIDADVDICVEFLADKTWEQRHRWFNNAICESLENLAKVTTVFQTRAVELDGDADDDIGCFRDGAIAEMDMQIGRILDGVGETTPPVRYAIPLC